MIIATATFETIIAVSFAIPQNYRFGETNLCIEIDLTMTVSITQVLDCELDRLFSSIRCGEEAFVRDNEIEKVFRDVVALRASANNIIRRYLDELSKDELIETQSKLNARFDEMLSRLLKELIGRRTLAVAEQAERDPVTMLPGRAAFDRKLRDEVERARRYHRHLSVVLFDIDGFKSVNDQFGHAVGDRVLLHVARTMKSSLRRSDAVFRYGGDEFAAICPETSSDAMVNVLRRLESDLRAWRIESQLSERFGISWGIASFPADAQVEGGLMETADQRLYACKREHQCSSSGR
jgi:diguanylate cyclase (GGDEF)-like protein